jgi:hypothetical protein
MEGKLCSEFVNQDVSGRSVWHELEDVMDGFIRNLLVNGRLRFKKMKWIVKNSNGKELQVG